jgi:hypothetical protein
MTEHFIARYTPDPRKGDSVFMMTDDQLFRAIRDGVQLGIDMPAPVKHSASGAALRIMQERGMVVDSIFPQPTIPVPAENLPEI